MIRADPRRSGSENWLRLDGAAKCAKAFKALVNLRELWFR